MQTQLREQQAELTLLKGGVEGAEGEGEVRDVDEAEAAGEGNEEDREANGSSVDGSGQVLRQYHYYDLRLQC